MDLQELVEASLDEILVGPHYVTLTFYGSIRTIVRINTPFQFELDGTRATYDAENKIHDIRGESGAFILLHGRTVAAMNCSEHGLTIRFREGGEIFVRTPDDFEAAIEIIGTTGARFDELAFAYRLHKASTAIGQLDR